MKHLYLSFQSWFLVLLLVVALGNPGQAQEIRQSPGTSIFGYSGQLFTPSAYVPQDRNFFIGYAHLSHEAAFNFFSQQNGVGEGIGFLNIGFLPFLELNIRVARPYGDNSDNTELGIGDRSYGLRLQLVKETELRPALTIGFHDLFNESSYFNTNYVVVSKSMSVQEFQLSGHLGYGYKLQDARGLYLQGVFGAATLRWKFVEGMVEYDTESINLGIRSDFKEIVYINLGLHDLSTFIANLSFRFRI